MKVSTAQRPSRRAAGRMFVVLVALATVLSGCVSIPDSGAVRSVEDGRPEQASPARFRPAGPVDGATPNDVVNGFLQAMMASPVRYDIARRFLTEGASDDWRPRDSVTVYSQTSVSLPETRTGGESVGVDLVREAVLSDQGRFTVPTSREQHLDLTLVKEEDQWRIADPPQGAMIKQDFFEDYYDSFNSYFFDASGSQLVAEPVHLPDDENLPTYLVSSVLKGPRGAVGGQARSFLPESWVLARQVEIDDAGVAVIRFDGSPAEVPLKDRERLSAQLVWSLRQIPAVTAVEIVVGERAVALPGTPRRQAVDAWTEYDPAADRSTELFAMVDGRLRVVDRTRTSPFGGVWGSDPVESDDFRVSVDRDRIALVTDGRKVVRVSPLTGEPQPVVVRQGSDLLRPSWDAAGRLWTLDRTRRGSTLTVGRPGERARIVGLGPLAGGRVTGFELSPDGARFVATARVAGRDGVYVGAVRYEPESETVVALVDVREIPVPAESGVPISAAWRSSTSLALLARAAQRAPQVTLVAIDSSSAATGAVRVGLLPQDGARQVLAPGLVSAPLYVLDARGMLWTQNNDGRWQQPGSDPVGSAGFAG
ncbi:GerMN domain-containing protein [Mumia sp. zg.B53]|uniref:LpqB family beta-propeller domain-containing protein n=1 Tax=Mumia sp. zg.B53 TaxID=2855449 RepID=UPI001C6E9DD3|nr:LpqB family beta-propeller domain-containing protein [Mumia sp. zg.B53]MBW9213722.1 GerMN domain-containing protein [Mumia sp. zg.B53]